MQALFSKAVSYFADIWCVFAGIMSEDKEVALMAFDDHARELEKVEFSLANYILLIFVNLQDYEHWQH